MKGTKPDRFDAIARNFYWLNVARFYAGCYSKGELPSLVESLDELSKADRFKFTSHPSTLAANMLSDFVFAQHPKSREKVVSLVIGGIGLRNITSGSRGSRINCTLALPSGNGREDIVGKCLSILSTSPASDYAFEVINLLRANSHPSEIRMHWYKELEGNSGHSRTRWLEYGLRLGLLADIPLGVLHTICNDDPGKSERLAILLRAGHSSYIELHDDLSDTFIRAVLERHVIVHRSGRGKNVLEAFNQVFDTTIYASAFQAPGLFPLAEASWFATGRPILTGSI